ncbi:G-protein coupled receptor 35-like [Alligator sinensis]|uniref:G-protein coupled receptor 35-like n=1 Tax=Alligator sinensis TaxID=38654 RepID=A0A3Q0H0D9_ALLSI|nr:G-protein coupled receptor 35-like [Alligator sinensis]
MTTNATNCTMEQIKFHYYIKLIPLFFHIPIFIFGAIFNALALWVFCCKLVKRTETKIYMINLVIADCSLVCVLPFLIYFHQKNWPRDEACLAVEIMYMVNMLMSIYIITAITVDRYIAIKHPLKAKSLRSPLKAAVTCGLLWLLVIISLYLRRRSVNESICLQKISTRPTIFLPFLFVFGFLIPLIILSSCSIQIIKTLRKRIHTNPHEKKIFQKSIYVVSANMTVFIVCFSPFCIGEFARFVMENGTVSCFAIQNVRNFNYIAMCIANSNCCLDTFCYYFVAKEFQEAFFFSKSNCSGTNQTCSSQRQINVTVM